MPRFKPKHTATAENLTPRDTSIIIPHQRQAKRSPNRIIRPLASEKRGKTSQKRHKENCNSRVEENHELQKTPSQMQKDVVHQSRGTRSPGATCETLGMPTITSHNMPGTTQKRDSTVARMTS